MLQKTIVTGDREHVLRNIVTPTMRGKEYPLFLLSLTPLPESTAGRETGAKEMRGRREII